MTDVSISVLAASGSAAIFAAAGAANLIAPKRILDMYEEWDVAPGLYRTLGVIEMVAAVCLATPSLRVWGLLLAGPIAFVSVVMLLDQQKYRCAACAVAVVGALFVTVLGAPQKPNLVVGDPGSQVVIRTANNSPIH
jgi:hypothetical protein